MMPDLGKYAFAVLAAYGASLSILLVLVLATFHAGRKARRGLSNVETRRSRDG